MSNSDYLLKAAIKKVTEKINDIVIEKIEEATNIAQDAPEIIKKEIEILKESIIQEAERMKSETRQNNHASVPNQDPKIDLALEEIKEINKQIDELDKKITNIF